LRGFRSKLSAGVYVDGTRGQREVGNVQGACIAVISCAKLRSDRNLLRRRTRRRFHGKLDFRQRILETSRPAALDLSGNSSGKIDLIERQVLCALTDPNNVWGEMWRRFAVATGDRTSNRGNSVREGVRFSGRQIMIPVELPRDPVPGAKPSALWDDFRTLAATDPELAPALAMIDAALAGSQVEPDWTVLSRAYALTAGGADALMVR